MLSRFTYMRLVDMFMGLSLFFFRGCCVLFVVVVFFVHVCLVWKFGDYFLLCFSCLFCVGALHISFVP